MRRSDGNAVILRSLGGIKDIGGELDNRIEEIHGMFDGSAASLKRIPGKLQNSTATSRIVLSIAQLRFRDRDAIVERNSSGLIADVGVPPVPGYVFPPFPDPSDTPSDPPPPYPPTPPGPDPFPPDWPEDPGPGDPPLPTGPSNPDPDRRMPTPGKDYPCRGVEITTDPSTMVFRLDLGESPTRELVIGAQETGYGWGGPWLSGFWHLQYAWDEDYSSAMNLQDYILGYNNGDIQSTLWMDGTLPAREEHIDVNIIPAAITDDIISFTLTVSAVEPQLWSPPAIRKNCDGSLIQDTVDITVIKAYPAVMYSRETTNWIPSVYELVLNWNAVGGYWKGPAAGNHFITLYPNGYVIVYHSGASLSQYVGWPTGGPVVFDLNGHPFPNPWVTNVTVSYKPLW
jgi:hypothetical protein